MYPHAGGHGHPGPSPSRRGVLATLAQHMMLPNAGRGGGGSGGGGVSSPVSVQPAAAWPEIAVPVVAALYALQQLRVRTQLQQQAAKQESDKQELQEKIGHLQVLRPAAPVRRSKILPFKSRCFNRAGSRSPECQQNIATYQNVLPAGAPPPTAAASREA